MKNIALISPTKHQVLNQNLNTYGVNLGGAFLDKAHSPEQVFHDTYLYITLLSASRRRQEFLLYPLNL